MSYFNNIPLDLINQICYNLTYTETLILREEFNFNLDYQYFFSNKYPGFYEIIKTVKNKTIRYRNYSYEEGYELIYLLLDYLEFLKNSDDYTFYNNLIKGIYTDDIENCYLIVYDNDDNIKDIKNVKDIIASYNMLENEYEYEYYKYRKYFPNMFNMDDIFIDICAEINLYETSDEQLLNDINSQTDDRLTFYLSVLYILLLEYENKIPEWKILIKKLNMKKIKKKPINVIIYQYIKNLINIH